MLEESDKKPMDELASIMHHSRARRLTLDLWLVKDNRFLATGTRFQETLSRNRINLKEILVRDLTARASKEIPFTS